MAEETTKLAEKRVMDMGLSIFGSSDNFTLAWQQAQALAQSNIVPSTFQKNPSNCLIAIEQAQRTRMSPFMVMQNLYIIGNRPTWSSKFLIAMINASGRYDMELQFDDMKDKNGKPYGCICWTTKQGRRIEGMEVNMDMAQAEGWLNKNGSKWKTMPQLMLRYRAASFFANLNCPDLTLGLYTDDEVIDNGMKAPKEIRVDSVVRDLKAEVADEIEENANQIELEIPDAD